MNQFLNTQISFSSKINYILISSLPIALLAGNLVVNTTVILICFFYLIDVFQKKMNYFLKDKNFYFLIIIHIYIILNSIFISQNQENLFKAITFIRFSILAYAISFYFLSFKNEIIKLWFVTFLVVSFDIVFEYIFGNNILGFKSNYAGRIASFTGDELQIGGYYFGFIFLSLSFFETSKRNLFIYFSIVFFIISLIIGERSNFIKILIMFLIFFIFFINLSFYKKTFLILLMIGFSLYIINNNSVLQSKFKYHIFKPNFSLYFDKMKLKYLPSDRRAKYIIFYSDGFKNDLNLIEVVKENRHLSHYYAAILIFKENYIFGSGFKTFKTESFKEKYVIKNFHGAGNHPHQFHFEILSELGIVGYILIISNLFYVLLRNYKLNKTFLEKSGILFVLASLIPLLPSGSFFTTFGSTVFFINYSFLLFTNDLKIQNLKKAYF